jgi:hypothetical protein
MLHCPSTSPEAWVVSPNVGWKNDGWKRVSAAPDRMLLPMHEPMSKSLREAGFKACFRACPETWAPAGLSSAVRILGVPSLTLRLLIIPLLVPVLSIPLLLALPSHGLAAESLRCLTGDEQRAAIANGKTMPLATVIHSLRRAPKDVIKAQLCQEPERLVYKLTLLGRDGKVKRATVDATNGAVVGER